MKIVYPFLIIYFLCLQVSNAQVGIGTTNPDATLHIVGTTIIGSSGGLVELLNEDFTGYTVIENNSSVGCTVDGWENTTTGDANVNCTSCSGNWLFIDSDESGCTQNSTAIISLTTSPSSTTIDISFDYRYKNFGASGDSFRVYLYNNTLSSQEGVDLINTTADANTNYSNSVTVIAGNSYSLRFEYNGDYDYGASLDNVLVTETSVASTGAYTFRLEDGQQQDGFVMTSDANGYATWMAPSGGGSGTDNQTIDVLTLSGSTLNISLEDDGIANQTLDLSSLSDGTGTDDQTIDVFSLSGSTLNLSLEGDGEATKTVDLSGLGGGGSYSFDNGIYETSGNVRLGGPLTEDTNVELGTYDLEFNVSGLGDFVLQKNGVDKFTFDDYGDLQIDSDNRTHAMYLRASDDLVSFGAFNTVDSSDGTTLTDSGGINYTKDFALAVYTGSSGGSGFQMGSIEYFVDGTAELFTNYDISPETNGGADLGTASYRWGTIYATDGTINTSDITLKKNISPLSYGLNELMKLNPITYNWKESKRGKTSIPQNEEKLKIGFSAQELLNVIPEVVNTHSWVASDEKGNYKKVKNDKLGVFYSDIIPVTVKAIQEQQEQIVDLKNEVETLKNELENLKKLILSKQ